MYIPGFESRRALFDQEATNAAVVGLGPNESDIGKRAIGDPHLLAIEEVTASAAHGAREHAGGIGAELRLRQSETTDGAGAVQRGQPFLLLLGGPKGMDGIHNQRALHRDEASQTGVAALEFLHDLAVGDIGHPGAIVAGEIGAKESQLGHWPHKLEGESTLAIMFFDDRENFAVHELARGLANEALVVV